jgi:hypothetical protein
LIGALDLRRIRDKASELRTHGSWRAQQVGGDLLHRQAVEHVSQKQLGPVQVSPCRRGRAGGTGFVTDTDGPLARWRGTGFSTVSLGTRDERSIQPTEAE